MTSIRSVPRQAASHGGGSSTEDPGTVVLALMSLSTAVGTGLSGVYLTTRSVAVTALVAGLIALLALCVVLRAARWR